MPHPRGRGDREILGEEAEYKTLHSAWTLGPGHPHVYDLQKKNDTIIMENIMQAHQNSNRAGVSSG